jgi:hypothetical protein
MTPRLLSYKLNKERRKQEIQKEQPEEEYR